MQLDYSYVRHWTFQRDLAILARTAGIVLSAGERSEQPGATRSGALPPGGAHANPVTMTLHHPEPPRRLPPGGRRLPQGGDRPRLARALRRLGALRGRAPGRVPGRRGHDDPGRAGGRARAPARRAPSALQRIPGATSHHEWLLPLMPLAWRMMAPPSGVDAVISSSHACAKAVPVEDGTPHLQVLHADAVRLGLRRRAERFPLRLARRRGALMAWFRRWDRATAAA